MVLLHFNANSANFRHFLKPKAIFFHTNATICLLLSVCLESFVEKESNLKMGILVAFKGLIQVCLPTIHSGHQFEEVDGSPKQSSVVKFRIFLLLYLTVRQPFPLALHLLSSVSIC